MKTVDCFPSTSEVILITSGNHVTKDALVMIIMSTGAFKRSSEVVEVIDAKSFQETIEKAY